MRLRRTADLNGGHGDDEGQAVFFNEFNETPLKVDVSRRGGRRTCLMIVCSHVVW